MTISTPETRNEYTATAAQVTFNYTFKIFAATDLNVYVTASGAVCDDATDITTAYTVTGVGNAAGGTIIRTTPSTAGELVTIVGNIPASRTTDYQTNGDFLPDTVNDDFDRVVSLVKQVEDLSNRSVLTEECQQGPKPLKLDAPAPTEFLRWKSDSTGIESVDLATSGSPTNASVITYNQGGISATNRTAENKFQESLSVKDFGAAGDGVTDDTAAMLAAVAAVKLAGGGEVFFPTGTYNYAAAIVNDFDQLTLRGENWFSTELKNNSTAANLIEFSTKSVVQHFVMKDLYINAANVAGGHAFHQATGVGQHTYERVRVTQANPAKRIWNNVDGEIYIDVHWDIFDMVHVITSTVHAVNFVDSTGGLVNSNSWKRGRVTNCNIHFFNIECNAANSEFDNVFENINFEICKGGGIRGRGVQNLTIYNVYNYDNPSATGDFIDIDTSGTGQDSTRNTIKNVFRRNSTFSGGAVDIKLGTSGCENTTIQGGDNATKTGYIVDVGNNLGIVLIDTRNWTINNRNVTTVELASYLGGNRVGVTIGDNVQFTYDTGLADAGRIEGAGGCVIEGPVFPQAGAGSGTAGDFVGSGTPEGSQAAPPGSTYRNDTIASTEFAFYLKRTGTGNTGWEGQGTVLP